VFIVDVPAVAVSDNCRDGFDPTFSGPLVSRRNTEPTNPDLISLDGLLGQCPRPTLHRFVPFLEAPGHVRVREPYRSWDQSCDEIRAGSTRRSGDLCPTVDSVAEDSGGVPRVIERPCCYEPGESLFHIEAVRLGVSEGGEKWTVGGALTNPL
jgi:hypothetical protein